MYKHLIIPGGAQSPFLRSQLANRFYKFNKPNTSQLLSSNYYFSCSLWLFYLFFYCKIFHADLWRLTSHLTAWEVAVSIASEIGWRNIMNIMIAIYAFWLEVKPKFNINKSTFCHSSILNRAFKKTWVNKRSSTLIILTVFIQNYGQCHVGRGNRVSKDFL